MFSSPCFLAERYFDAVVMAGLTEASPADQGATHNACAPKDDDHAKVALELGA
jgi:hypothetical protein